MAINKDTTTKKVVYLPNLLWKWVDDFRFEHRLKSEGEAIRRLIEAGLRLEIVKARALSLEKQIIEIAQRAGATEAELDEIRAKLAFSRRMTEPLGPDPKE